MKYIVGEIIVVKLKGALIHQSSTATKMLIFHKKKRVYERSKIQSLVIFKSRDAFHVEVCLLNDESTGYSVS
ncbi:hypothetical protein [Metabacillus litoralis]|uniref:hypothetical protein n=1 Tax=Metabacillus litoralis TaxID=152268 RepID=UPI0013CEA1AA|nr:hypothetical protein [Metabacillus litoralis]